MDEPLNYSQSIFWIDVEKISPNPYQPRKEFDQASLQSLAQSIKQYGVLQPLVVTRKEYEREDGSIVVTYELIAGERRLRAARLAGIPQVPALIRDKGDNDKAKLEIAIIENLQREDLNPVDRARAFNQLAKEFNLTHAEIALKIGKSREYISNTIRILMLPEDILNAVVEGHISEGHTRPMLMLHDRPEELRKLYSRILSERITVREAEAHSRRIAQDKIRRHHRIFDRDTIALEEELAEKLGTRVRIDKRNEGGKITIDFFSPDDLENLLRILASGKNEEPFESTNVTMLPPELVSGSEEGASDEDLYSIKNFTI